MAANTPSENEREDRTLPADEASLVLQCPRCDGRMRAPLRERGFTVICPHCPMEFKINGQREPIPDAGVKG